MRPTRASTLSRGVADVRAAATSTSPASTPYTLATRPTRASDRPRRSAADHRSPSALGDAASASSTSPSELDRRQSRSRRQPRRRGPGRRRQHRSPPRHGNVTLTITQPSAPVGAALTCATDLGARSSDGEASRPFAGCCDRPAPARPYTLLATDDDVGVVATHQHPVRDHDRPRGQARVRHVTERLHRRHRLHHANPASPSKTPAATPSSAVHVSVTLDITRPSNPVGAALACTEREPADDHRSESQPSSDAASTSRAATTYTLEATVTRDLTSRDERDVRHQRRSRSRRSCSRDSRALTTANGERSAQQPEVSVEDAGGNVVTTDNGTSVTLDISRPSTPPEARSLTCTSNHRSPSSAESRHVHRLRRRSAGRLHAAVRTTPPMSSPSTSDVFTIT